MDEVLIPAAKEKPVYLFAGDVGAWGNLTPYYEELPDAESDHAHDRSRGHGAG